MTVRQTDILIIGAGPVGLMCAYLGQLCGLNIVIVDKTVAPLKVGRADALNARTLQLLETVDLFDELYPLGKKCNTSSVWSNGKFLSRESSWWNELKGCEHRHFLMLGQSFVEKLLDRKLKEHGHDVLRSKTVKSIQLMEGGCLTRLSNGDVVESKYVIGADGPRSFVRDNFDIKFEVKRPKLIWAVIDGVVNTDFPKVNEIIVFQAETADVAWIPREGNLDRFYVRMETTDFGVEEAISKIKRALRPHQFNFKEIVWFSKFSVKESVADQFYKHDRIFLAGDSCHIHSVNGGQGLNTGIGDAFNLMWKLNMVLKSKATKELLNSYEQERKPVALSVIESSGELVRSTKYSKEGTHAQDYVKIVKKRSGNITGMGIRYGTKGLSGNRLYDFRVLNQYKVYRIYTLLDYTNYTLLIFSKDKMNFSVPDSVNIIQIYPFKHQCEMWTEDQSYTNQAVLVRPDSYIAWSSTLDEISSTLLSYFYTLRPQS